jgi:hypothetical protein
LIRALTALLVLTATPAAAATITTYSTETAFVGAAGPEGLLRENFDGFDAGTPITTLQGLTFSSPNQFLEGFQPIETYDASGFTSSDPMIARGGFVPGSETVAQIMQIAFEEPVLAFGTYLIGYHPAATAGTITFHFTDESTQTLDLVNPGVSQGATNQYLRLKAETLRLPPSETAVLLSPRGHQRIFVSCFVAPPLLPSFGLRQQRLHRLVRIGSVDLAARRRKGLAFLWHAAARPDAGWQAALVGRADPGGPRAVVARRGRQDADV